MQEFIDDKRIRKLSFLFFVLFCLSSVVAGQKSISNISYDPPSDIVEVMFDVKTTSTIIDKVFLFDVKTGNSIKTNYSVKAGFLVLKDTLALLNVVPSPDTHETIFWKDPKFLQKNPVSIIVLFKPQDDNPPLVLSGLLQARIASIRADELKKEAPKGRDDAEIYLSGETVTAVDSKPVFSADIKYDKPWTKLSTVNIGPLLSYKGSTNPKADPDRLRAAIKLSGFLWESKLQETTRKNQQTSDKEKRCFLCFLDWEATAELEANRRFTVKNLITSDRLYFNFRTFVLSSDKTRPVRDSVLMRFRPFLGAELGRNLSSPIQREEKTIGRLVAGASLNFFFPSSVLKSLGVEKGITWENSFTQRWFVTPEIAYDKDKNGNLILANFGRRPRSYFSSKINFLFNDYFGPSLTYEWGDQPPLYNRVKHQVKFGFTFSQKTKAAK